MASTVYSVITFALHPVQGGSIFFLTPPPLEHTLVSSEKSSSSNSRQRLAFASRDNWCIPLCSHTVPRAPMVCLRHLGSHRLHLPRREQVIDLLRGRKGDIHHYPRRSVARDGIIKPLQAEVRSLHGTPSQQTHSGGNPLRRKPGLDLHQGQSASAHLGHPLVPGSEPGGLSNPCDVQTLQS